MSTKVLFSHGKLVFHNILIFSTIKTISYPSVFGDVQRDMCFGAQTVDLQVVFRILLILKQNNYYKISVVFIKGLSISFEHFKYFDC